MFFTFCPNDVQLTIGNVDFDQVIVLDQGNGAAFNGFRRDVTNAGTGAGTGETAIRNQGNRVVQRLVIYDRIGSHVHFRHTGPFRTFIADNDDTILWNLPFNNRIIGSFFRVEYQRLTNVMVHFRYRCRIFDNAAIRCNIPFHNGYRTIHRSFFRRCNDIFRANTKVAQVTVAAFKEAIFPKCFQIFTQRLARAGHDIQVQLIPDQPFNHGHATGHPEHFTDIFAIRLYIYEVLDFAVDFIKDFRIQFDT